MSHSLRFLVSVACCFLLSIVSIGGVFASGFSKDQEYLDFVLTEKLAHMSLETREKKLSLASEKLQNFLLIPRYELTLSMYRMLSDIDVVLSYQLDELQAERAVLLEKEQMHSSAPVLHSAPVEKQVDVEIGGGGKELWTDLRSDMNELRRKKGVLPLKYNATLQRIAQDHAEYMSKHDRYEHETLEGVTTGQRADKAGYDRLSIGENLAGYVFKKDKIIPAWYASTGHRDVMLDGDFYDVGIGYEPTNGSWVAVFGVEY